MPIQDRGRRGVQVLYRSTSSLECFERDLRHLAWIVVDVQKSRSLLASILGQHVFKFRDMLSRLGHAAGNDFVLGSDVGDARKGFQATNVDFQHVVQEALPGAACCSSGSARS